MRRFFCFFVIFVGASCFGQNYQIRKNPKDSTWPCVKKYESLREVSDCYIKEIRLEGKSLILNLLHENKTEEYCVNISKITKEDLQYLRLKRNDHNLVRRDVLKKRATKALYYASKRNIACKFCSLKGKSRDVVVLRVPTREQGTESVLMCEKIGRKLNSKIRTYHSIGSYNTGTKFFDNLLHINLKLPREPWWPLGWKHHPYKPLDQIGLENPQEEVLVLFIVRNPIDWLESMHRHPYYTSGLVQLPFDQFIHAQWVTHELDRNPDTGEYFNNIFELRESTAHRMLNLKNTFRHFYFVNYEVLRKYPAEVLADIASTYGCETRSFFTNLEKLTRSGKCIPFRKNENPDRYSQKELDQFDGLLNSDLERELGY